MSKVSVHQRKARDFIQREDWGNALVELERLLEADGENPTLHNQIGDVYLRKEDVPRACEHFESAIDLYAEVGLHNNAVALCKKVMRLRPGRFEMRFRLARLRFDQGFRSEAAAFCRDYLDHVPADADYAEKLEANCREIVDLMPDDAPVGKILDKLEEAQRFVAAFEIVRKLAQRAADAGDDAASRRYAEKLRSLRILVERSGGRDLLSEPLAAASAAEPGVTAEIDLGAMLSAPVERRAASEPTAAPPKSLVPEPGRIDLAQLADLLDAPAPKPASFAPRTGEVDLGSIDMSLPGEADLGTWQGGVVDLDVPDAGAPGAEATSDHAPVEFTIDDVAPLETSAAAIDDDAAIDVGRSYWSEARPLDTGAEPEAELEPELDSGPTAFADLASDLGDSLLSPESEAAPAPDNDATPTWMPRAAEWDAPLEPEAAPPLPGDTGPGWAQEVASWNDAASEAEPLLPPATTTPRAVPPFATPPPASGSGWIEELRRAPVWIPTGDTLMDPEPESHEGAHMELESVIDSFREQMARALDGDGAARYDLGVAYYEMGLYNEALAEFESAARSPGLEVQSFEMLAACLLQTGRHAEVVELLLPVLAADGHSPRGRLGLHYSLGLAYEALGDWQQAQRCFEEVALVDIDFKDVQTRLHRT